MLRRVVFLLFVCLGAASPAFAQDEALSQLLVRLLQETVRLAPPPPGVVFSHEAHFLPGATQELAPFFFNQTIVAQLARIPLGSSSGGFTFQLDPAAGTFRRSTPTFGPSFAERAVTIGKKKLNFGFSFQRATYDGYEGKDLDGEVKFHLTHQPIGNPPFFFEGDIVEETLRLDLSTNTTTLFGSYGLTDNLEIALAVPIVNVSMDAAVDAQVLRLATTPDTSIHRFPDGSDRATFSDSGSASGIGDIVLRSKYVFYQVGGGGVAAGLDLRLPTGDEDNLLGAGAAEAILTLIGSQSVGRFAPHFNIGYGFSGEGEESVPASDEFIYTFGTEIEASPKVTVNADVLGRVYRDIGRLAETDTVFHFMNAAGVSGSQTLSGFTVEEGNLNTLTAAVGVKINLGRTFLLSGNVLFPLRKSGIYDKATPVFGIDYVF
jgi:Putative MetA-pathway of phenol degradation